MKILICVLALFISYAHAEQALGNWRVNVDASDMQVAKVFNAANSVAGVMCFTSSNNCSAYLGADFACESGAKYPLMLNSSQGANSVMAECLYVGGSPYLLISETATVVAAFETEGEVGFALPMQSGQFRVFRFNCLGASRAIYAVRAYKAPTATKNPASQTL